ncbi:MAG: DUF86 domain-containing protein [Flavobacterium sp.]
MDIKIQAWLLDIKVCIEEIDEFLGSKRDFIAYQKDKMKKKAIERNLEIIGEAVNRILKLYPDFSLDNAKNIIGTRNRIIHSYDNISDEVIWTIITRELPLLKSQVEELIQSE